MSFSLYWNGTEVFYNEIFGYISCVQLYVFFLHFPVQIETHNDSVLTIVINDFISLEFL